MSRRRRAVAISAFLVLAGCGDDGSKQAGPPTTIGQPADTSVPSTTVGSTSTPTSVAPATPTWQALPAAPIVGRIGAGVVWSGREMIVWGGLPSTGEIGMTVVGDGAAYDPVARSWRTIAPAPAGVVGLAGQGSAWTGDEAVFWAGNSPDGPAAGAVYNPGTDTWRALAAGPLTIREGYVSVWTGSELVIMGGHGGKSYAEPVAAAVDPRTGTWRDLPSFADFVGFQPTGAFWDGRQILAAGSLALCPEQGSGCSEHRPVLVAYDPATDTRREIDLAGAPFAGDDVPHPVGWTGTELVFTTGDGPGPGIVRYDPASGRWRTGATSPCDRESSGYGQSAWLGDRLVVSCGDDQLQVYDPSPDSWRIVDAGPSPLNARARSEIAWTGTDLIVWSGELRAEYNPTADDGSSINLSR